MIYGVAALLAVPWIWTSIPPFARGTAIAWLALTAAIGILCALAGVQLFARGRGAVRWAGGVSVVAGVGLCVLAVAMLPVAYESTWAV